MRIVSYRIGGTLGRIARLWSQQEGIGLIIALLSLFYSQSDYEKMISLNI